MPWAEGLVPSVVVPAVIESGVGSREGGVSAGSPGGTAAVEGSPETVSTAEEVGSWAGVWRVQRPVKATGGAFVGNTTGVRTAEEPRHLKEYNDVCARRSPVEATAVALDKDPTRSGCARGVAESGAFVGNTTGVGTVEPKHLKEYTDACARQDTSNFFNSTVMCIKAYLY